MSKIDGIKLSDLIAPQFYPVHWDIADGKHTYYDLYGGRGSTKSSFIGVELPLGIMQDPLANGIVFRKVASTIGTYQILALATHENHDNRIKRNKSKVSNFF